MNLNFDRVLQVGMVVRDLDQALDFYTNTVGWGPFTIFEDDQGIKSDRKGGTPYSGRIRVAVTAWDSKPCLELIQPLSGDNLFSRHLDRHGEGLHHLFAGLVDDLDVVLPELEKQGIRTILYGPVPEFQARVAYVVGERTRNIILEISDRRC